MTDDPIRGAEVVYDGGHLTLRVYDEHGSRDMAIGRLAVLRLVQTGAQALGLLERDREDG